MLCFRVLTLMALVVVGTQAYSGGAPVDVCEDMTPKHPAEPQKSKMPYTLTVSSDAISAGQTAKVTISGKDGFKGFLLQARQGSTPVGKFIVSDDDRFVKTINCGKGEQVMFEMLRQFLTKFVPGLRRLLCGNMLQNAATHKNSFSKNNLSIEWQAPQELKGQVQFYVTVALDGGTYWVQKPTAKITVK